MVSSIGRESGKITRGGPVPERPSACGQGLSGKEAGTGTPLATDTLQLSATPPRCPLLPGGAVLPEWDGPRQTDPAKPDVPRHRLKVSAGYHRNRYSKSDITIVQPAYGNRYTLHDVAAVERTSFEYIYSFPKGYPQIDEPESTVKVNYLDRQKNIGAEVSLDHHKYVVKDFNQQVRVAGTIGGQPVDEVRSLGDMMWQYEHTTGLNRVSLKFTKAFELPAPRKDSFTFNTKLGPAAYVLWTRSALYNHQGDPAAEKKSGPYHLGGYGCTLENSLEYTFRNQVSLELFHALSYANLTDALITNGHAQQSFWINQFGFTLGKCFNWK